MRRIDFISRFRSDERGSTTIWNIFWMVFFLLVAGLAIDASNAYRYRMVLQTTADSSSVAAAMSKDRFEYYETYMGQSSAGLTGNQRATQVAIDLSQRNMNTSKNGDVLKGVDIRFGSWTSGGGFVEGPGTYVEVITRRSAQNNNSVATTLLGMFGGLPSWDIVARSVAGKFDPDCAKNGVITSDVIDLQSNNRFVKEICLHGQKGVEVNQNNFFDYEDGVVVSMPDLDLLVVPGGDMSKNEGLEEALDVNNLEPVLALQVDDILAGLIDLTSNWQPDYTTVDSPAPEVIDVNKNDFDPDTLQSGKVYNISCSGGGNDTLNLRGPGGGGGGGKGKGKGGGGGGGTTTIQNMVIVTDCKVSLSDDTIIQDAIIATSNTSDMSIKGSSGVSVGKADNCAEGGGAQLITAGGMNFAAKMQFNGSQLVSKGPIHLAAQVDGFNGTSIQSTGRVDLASNNEMGLCEGDADPELEYAYYHIVE